MPRIVVVTEQPADRVEAVVHQERVLPAHVHDEHASSQLIERVRWAIEDADRLERTQPPSHPSEA